MHASICLPVLAALALAGPSAASTVVLPVTGPGLLLPIANDLEDGVRAAVAARGVTAQPREATRAVINDAAAGGLQCNLADVGCAARIGAIAGAERVIVASTESAGGALLLTLTDVDVAAKKVAAYGVARVETPQGDGGRSVRALVDRVLAPPALLTIRVDIAGATVAVDGVTAGAAPLRGPMAVDSGTHTVSASLAGYAASETSIDAEPHARSAVAIAMRPPELPRVAENHPAAATPTTTPPTTTTTPATAPATTTPTTAHSPVVLYAGIGTAAVGGILAAACGIAAGAVEVQLEHPTPGDDTPLRNVGMALLGGAAVGVLGLAVGGTVLALDLGG